jgi:hypothetical protein
VAADVEVVAPAVQVEEVTPIVAKAKAKKTPATEAPATEE